MRFLSPLRYPGGKASIFPMMAAIFEKNGLSARKYFEPYAGGCGLALSLLTKGYVSELHLNDLDRSIFCFWQVILTRPAEFIAKIISTKISLGEWYKQKEVQQNKFKVSDFDLAFSTFFLNRTNRSGVIFNGGAIGGHGQTGKYKIDCRFNKDSLIKRIMELQKYRHLIHFYNLDAVEFMSQTSTLFSAQGIYYLDPPYFNKGSRLYANSYSLGEHSILADYLNNSRVPWVLTYDNCAEIRELYTKQEKYTFAIKYSLAKKRKENELLIISNNLLLPCHFNNLECTNHTC